MAAYNLSPIGNGTEFFNANGTIPNSGGFLASYAAGTTTPLALYTTSAGGPTWATMIPLGTDGRVNGEIWIPAGTAVKFQAFASDGLTQIPNSEWDNIVGINDIGAGSSSNWLASGVTPIYSSATQFTTAGNTTATFPVGTRIQATVTAGTVYGTVSSSSFSVATTVNLTMDPSESLDSGLSAVNVSNVTPLAVPGILGYTFQAANLSTGGTLTVTGTAAVTGTSTFTGKITGNGGFHGTLDATSALANGVTGTTQAALDNSTKVATTAYVDSAVTAAAQPWSIFISAQISGTSVNHQLHEGNTISGVTNGSTGIYVVSFTSNFAAATYGIQVTAQSAGDPCYAYVAAQAVGSCTIHIVDTTSDALVNNPFTITVTY
jgi:hypothetical protein